MGSSRDQARLIDPARQSGYHGYPMSRVTLITDADTPLGAELLRRCLERGAQVIATVSSPPPEPAKPARGTSSRAAAPQPAPPAAVAFLEWKRRTPLSAINGLLQAVDAHDRLDEAIVLNAPAGERKLLHETPTAVVEETVDHWVKGNLFLVREILRLFRRRKAGVLALVNYAPLVSGGALSPLDGAVWGGFQSLCESLFASCNEEPFVLNGFESHSEQPGEFADYILDALQEKGSRVCGRWFRHQGRAGLLSTLRLNGSV